MLAHLYHNKVVEGGVFPQVVVGDHGEVVGGFNAVPESSSSLYLSQLSHVEVEGLSRGRVIPLVANHSMVVG